MESNTASNKNKEKSGSTKDKKQRVRFLTPDKGTSFLQKIVNKATAQAKSKSPEIETSSDKLNAETDKVTGRTTSKKSKEREELAQKVVERVKSNIKSHEEKQIRDSAETLPQKQPNVLSKSLDELKIEPSSRRKQAVVEDRKTSLQDVEFPDKIEDGVKRLTRLGFRLKDELSSQKIEEDSGKPPQTSKEAFKETYLTFPQAKVSGTKTSVSYILPKKSARKKEEDQVSEKQGTTILTQTFDSKEGENLSEEKSLKPSSEYFRRRAVPSHLKDILKKNSYTSSSSFEFPHTSEDPSSKPSTSKKIDSIATSSRFVYPQEEEKRFYSGAKESSSERLQTLTPQSDMNIDLDLIPKVEAVSSADEKKTTLLPELSSSAKIVERDEVQIKEFVIGEKGFIAELLEDVLSEQDSKLKEKVQPFRKQDPSSRKSAMEEVDKEIKAFFTEPSMYKKKKKRTSPKSLKSSPHLRNSESEEKPNGTGVHGSKSTTSSLSHLKTEWQPRSLEKMNVKTVPGFHQREKSWVGTYVVGTDYWTKLDDTKLEEPEKITFAMDKEKRAWYDIHASTSSINQIYTAKIPKVTKEKLKTLKTKLPETEVGVLKQGREHWEEDGGGVLPPNWNEELQDIFTDLVKGDELAAAQNRMSLANVDKWLEKVDILDYRNLTAIQTGFCFKAAGGSRYKGLNFTEFVTFLKLIGETRKMPFPDIVGRLKLAHMGIDIDGNT